jgi:hypothetical protein
MKPHILILEFILTFTIGVFANDFNKVGFVIMSQSHRRHELIAEETRNKLIADLKKKGIERPTVFTSHKDLPNHGAWSYFPLFPSNFISQIIEFEFVNTLYLFKCSI